MWTHRSPGPSVSPPPGMSGMVLSHGVARRIRPMSGLKTSKPCSALGAEQPSTDAMAAITTVTLCDKHK